MKRLNLAILLILLCLSVSYVSRAQDGYAMINGTTTGGAGGTTVTVTTAANLITYATSASPYIIRVSGTILSLIHISEPTRQAESRMPSSA